MKDVAIGIDLGTTYCCMAVYRNGKVEIIPNGYNANTTPSYVHIDDNNFVTAGPAAKGKAKEDTSGAIYDAKRLIGRRFDDPVVKKDMEIWPFKVIEDGDTYFPRILVNERSYVPEQISAHVLEYLKRCAEEYLNCTVTKAVITVPAYFNELQRHVTKLAGTLAGLEVLKLMHEPTAAAVTYCYRNKSFSTEKTILVFDLGGGTFDVVVMTIKDRKIEVKAVGGDSHLGGQDIDRNLVEYCLKEFKAKNGIDLTAVGPGRDEAKVARLLRRLKTECEEIKMQLSYTKKSVISMNNVHGDTDLAVRITREEFEELNDPLLQKCVNTVKAVVKDAKLTTADIDEVIMVGGSSRIPKLQELVMGLFKDKKPNKTINADEAMASGAAIQAALMTTDCAALKDIFPDIMIRDPASPSFDTKSTTTSLINTGPAEPVYFNEMNAPTKNNITKLTGQSDYLESKCSTEMLKPISSTTNAKEKRDDIFVKLQMIANGLIKNDIREITNAWNNIYEVLCQKPGNCEIFLEHGGIELFLKSLYAFPDQLYLKLDGLYTMTSVARHEHLRPQLMKSELITVFYNFLDSNEDENSDIYLAAEFLTYMLSDGEDAWKIESPRRTDVLTVILRSVKRWEDQSFNFDFCTLKHFLKVINVTHTTECQLFAAWFLRNLTKVHPEHFVPLLVREGGLDILNQINSEDKDVRKFVRTTLNQCYKYLSRTKPPK